MTDSTTLTPRQQRILDFEGGPHWRYAGARDDEIRRRFDCTPTRYAQELRALLDMPAAEAYAPSTVRRLRRLIDARASR